MIKLSCHQYKKEIYVDSRAICLQVKSTSYTLINEVVKSGVLWRF